MSSPEFTLDVPTDPGYRSLACEVIGRYVDLVGGTEPERAAFVAELGKAIDTLVGSDDADLECTCIAHPPGFEITLRCHGRSVVVRHPVAAR